MTEGQFSSRMTTGQSAPATVPQINIVGIVTPPTNSEGPSFQRKKKEKSGAYLGQGVVVSDPFQPKSHLSLLYIYIDCTYTTETF